VLFVGRYPSVSPLMFSSFVSYLTPGFYSSPHLHKVPDSTPTIPLGLLFRRHLVDVGRESELCYSLKFGIIFLVKFRRLFDTFADSQNPKSFFVVFSGTVGCMLLSTVLASATFHHLLFIITWRFNEGNAGITIIKDMPSYYLHIL